MSHDHGDRSFLAVYAVQPNIKFLFVVEDCCADNAPLSSTVDDTARTAYVTLSRHASGAQVCCCKDFFAHAPPEVEEHVPPPKKFLPQDCWPTFWRRGQMFL